MQILAFTVLLGCLLGAASSLSMKGTIDPELDTYWKEYKTMHNKNYEGETDFIRRLIWESNLQYIERHNLEYDMGKHTYTLGMNAFGDLTLEEFKAAFLGTKPPSRNASNVHMYMPPLNTGALPDTVDWRTKGYVTGVKNQGQCGSCWSFSATGSLEGQYFRKTGQLVSFSEQQLVDCSRAYGNQGCNGGLMDSAFRYIQAYGIEREDVYPYTARDGNCQYNAGQVVTKVTGFTDIPSRDENSLQNAVATQGPVSVAIDASHVSFQLYRNGVNNEPACSQTQLDHGVLAVGYGTNGSPYWLVKNSWGGSWGQQGYIQMSRNNNNQCGIATMASYPSV